MALHFISVLGTGNYIPIVYQFENYTGAKQEFIQLALFEVFREQLRAEDAKVSIIMTPPAKTKNWEDNAGNRKLKTQIKENFPEIASKVKEVSIPNPLSEESTWEVFNKIYDAIEPDDEIIFDITHSFRSIPMLAITVINYAKTLKGCRLRGIYYGAFEAKSDNSQGIPIAPIFNLTIYNDILEWNNAANAFMTDGNASLMKKVLADKKKTLSVEEKRSLKPIEDIVGAASNLSETIYTSRGIGASSLQNDKNKKNKSIQAAVQAYKRQCENIPDKSLFQLTPIYSLLDKTQEAFAELDQEENYRTGIQVVKWCIRHQMTQQGYTALEETVVTYLCHKYGVEEADHALRETIISRPVSLMTQAIGQMNSQGIRYALKDVAERLEYQKDYPDMFPDDTWNEAAQRTYLTVDIEFVKLMKNLQQYRNDINHFGMREDPKEAGTLIKKLREYLEAFEQVIERR